MNLHTLRAKIDEIDTSILLCIQKRMAASEKMRSLKRGKSIVDPAREQELHSLWEKRSNVLGLSPTLSRSILTLLLKESKRLQRRTQKR